MAMQDDAVYLPAIGYIYKGDVGTEAPSVSELDDFPKDPPSDWENMGHTSRDDLPSWGHDGGDPEVMGTWQKRNFRSVVTEAATEELTINVHQLTADNLEMFFGRGDGGDEPGEYSADAEDGQNPEYALLIVIVDGKRKAAFWSPRCSFTRDGDLELDAEEFLTLPIKATLLEEEGMPFFKFIADSIGSS